MEALNVLSPSIEPHVSGHIIEQIELVKEIMKNGYAYESEGSVYFDVAKYNKDHQYGKLSGRNLDDVLNTTRELDGQSEKHNPADFARHGVKAAPVYGSYTEEYDFNDQENGQSVPYTSVLLSNGKHFHSSPIDVNYLPNTTERCSQYS